MAWRLVLGCKLHKLARVGLVRSCVTPPRFLRNDWRAAPQAWWNRRKPNPSHGGSPWSLALRRASRPGRYTPHRALSARHADELKQNLGRGARITAKSHPRAV